MKPSFWASPTRWFIVIVPLIIASFIAAHMMTISVVRRLEGDVTSLDSIAGRLHLLSTIRANLHLIGITATDAVDEAEKGGEFDRDTFEKNLPRVASELALYRSLVNSPEENQRELEVEEAIAALERVVDEMITTLDDGAFEKTHEIRSNELLPAVKHAAAAMNRLRAVEDQRLRQATLSVKETDEHIRRVAPLHDGVAAAFALLLMGLALNAARQYARLDAQRHQAAVERAEELEMFAGRVAHDLKNPLGALALRVDLGKRRHKEDPAVREEFVQLRSSVDRMDRIIEGLLDFARAGGQPELGARANLGHVLDELLADFGPDAAQAQATLLVEPFRSVTVACPPGPLASVLGNLLRNAIKYIVDARGAERRIVVRVRALGGKVRVEVDDTGPGLTAGSEGKMFEPFVRGGNRRLPGIGLGLATVKRLVEAYGGRVGVNTNPPWGSCFWFELPESAELELSTAPLTH